MQKELRSEKEKNARAKKKRQFWHKVLVYTVCLLIAAVVWLVVNYTMWHNEKNAEEHKSETALAVAETPQLLFDAEGASDIYG